MSDRLAGLMMMLQYTIVTEEFWNEKNQAEAYMYLTDGTVTVRINSGTAREMLRQANESPRYEIGYEKFNEPSGTSFTKHKDSPLVFRSATFHHVFIREDHFTEIMDEYGKDRRIHLIRKHSPNKKEATNG